jgi:hypothetical protein
MAALLICLNSSMQGSCGKWANSIPLNSVSFAVWVFSHTENFGHMSSHWLDSMLVFWYFFLDHHHSCLIIF